jgi:Tol biopolymer transport system component
MAPQAARFDNREIGNRLVLVVATLAVAIIAGGAATAAHVGRNGFLAVSFEPGSEHIWRVDPATGRAAAFATASKADELAWSPNGRILVFDDERRNGLTARATDERGRSLPLKVRGYALSFSPDGNRVVFQSCPLLCFAVSRFDGSGHKQIYRCRCAIYEPKWSPRGDRIVYIRQHDRPDGGVTYTIRLRTFTGRDKPLLGEGYPCFDQGGAVWSPDARTIAFSCADASHPKIYTVGADRGMPRMIANGDMPAWSPDGTQLTFARVNKDDTRTLSVLDLRTHRVRALLTRRIIYSIAWQPAN